MLELLLTIVNWIIEGVESILNIIGSIPKYTGYIFGYFNVIPPFIRTFLYIALTSLIIIKIKRLVFD